MNYKIITKNKIRYITIPELTRLGLNNCFTTRDMDIGIRTNPSILDIKNNLILINETLDITPKVIFGGVQTHSKNIMSVLDIHQGEENDVGRFVPDTDGLVTNIEDLALFTTYADCTPIILFDSVKKVHGNVHSGWRGTLQRIGKEAVNRMVADYGCNPEHIIAIVGPSIGKDDFEVESDVMQQFQDEFDFHDQIIRQKDDIKYLIDIQKTNKRILLESGIQEKNITVIDLSTKSNPMLHSYRRDGSEFGLMGCITCL
ncbi:MAG TPA: peptidoglycan editing factor PgeF [Epulopiscium sp.]|nr:peptidoglycan editing factor PgeF [Candidatus Epulonipiscium sp.]